MADMRDVWRAIEREVRETPMPAEYAALRVRVLCNDCNLLLDIRLHPWKAGALVHAHFAARGFPIVGDPRYGGERAARMGLHALRLALPHPHGPHEPRELVLEAAPPRAFRDLLRERA